MLSEFLENWRKQAFARPGAKILLAVSGGIDSMVMAHLCDLAGIPYGVAHCNFQLRGDDSMADEALVRDWCLERQITCHYIRFDTKDKAKELKAGTQETARILRYDWFRELLAEHDYMAIATAHHRDDHVETVLMNLFRGTGIAGMHGILAKSNDVIRPMLFAGKQEIIAFAKANNVPYRNDTSNDSDDYTRNALRHHVVPVIEKHFPGAVKQISESIERFQEAELIYKKGIETERKKLIEQRGNDHYIPLRKLRNRSPLPTLLYELLLPFGFTSKHIPDALQLIDAESGRYITSPTHRLIKNREFFIVTPLVTQLSDTIVINSFPATVQTPEHVYEFEIVNKPHKLDLGKDAALFHLKMIEQPLLLRKWKTGDYLYPLGMDMKKKKVSRMLINDKVPIHEKERVWVLESNKRIAWIAGIRIDERFKLHPNTEKALLVKRTAITN